MLSLFIELNISIHNSPNSETLQETLFGHIIDLKQTVLRCPGSVCIELMGLLWLSKINIKVQSCNLILDSLTCNPTMNKIILMKSS